MQKVEEKHREDPVGYPDFTKPITIVGCIIEAIPIDIKAQTLGVLKIDISTQSLEALNINILGGISDTRTDIGFIINPSFEEGEVGWVFGNGAYVEDPGGLFGTKRAVFPPFPPYPYVLQTISPPLDTNKIAQINLNVLLAVAADSGEIGVYYSDGTDEWTDVTWIGGGWREYLINFSPNKHIVMVEVWLYATTVDVYCDGFFLDRKVDHYVATTPTVNLNVDIKAQTVGNIAIDIAAQTVGNIAVNIAASAVTLNVAIQSSAVTLNVNIAAQTVDINIKTSGGANIIIDKLTVGAYTERRSTLSNNGETPSWWQVTGDERLGKFFPRGCRGFINAIEVYCQNLSSTVDATITVYLSPHPSMGPVATANISVPKLSAEAWRTAAFNRMWNYDSLFIFVVVSHYLTKIGYDSDIPYDRYDSPDGITWTHSDHRFWFKVLMKGETVGDVPVSGTLNVVEIPSLSAARQAQTLDVPAQSALYDTAQVGSGEILIVVFTCDSDAASSQLHPRILCDGASVLPVDCAFDIWEATLISSDTLGICLGKWDTTGHIYTIVVVVPYPFKRTLEVGFYNEHAETTYSGSVSYGYKRIS